MRWLLKLCSFLVHVSPQAGVFSQVLSATTASITTRASNPVSPIVLPIMNQAMKGGTIQRGIVASVGTHPQQTVS